MGSRNFIKETCGHFREVETNLYEGKELKIRKLCNFKAEIGNGGNDWNSRKEKQIKEIQGRIEKLRKVKEGKRSRKLKEG